MRVGEHDLQCVNHGGCEADGSLAAFVEGVRLLSAEIRSFDSGGGEGEYFSERLDELLKEHVDELLKGHGLAT